MQKKLYIYIYIYINVYIYIYIYIYKNLIKKFTNIYEFCDGDINKFILLLRKGVYSYEYMGSWERVDETFLTDKGAFYRSLNMEGTTNVD